MAENSSQDSENDDESSEEVGDEAASRSEASGEKSSPKDDDDDDQEDEEEEEENDDDDAEKAEEEEEETEKAPVVPRDDLKEELLHADINYGCVLSFYEMFGKFASLKEYSIKLLETHLLERDVLPKKWCDLHLILMKHLTMGKHAKKEKWLAYLERVSNQIMKLLLFDFGLTLKFSFLKFIKKYSGVDGLNLEKSGYLSLQLDVRVQTIKVNPFFYKIILIIF